MTDDEVTEHDAAGEGEDEASQAASKTAKLIKDLREEAKTRRLNERRLKEENESLKAQLAGQASNEPDDDTDDDTEDEDPEPEGDEAQGDEPDATGRPDNELQEALASARLELAFFKANHQRAEPFKDLDVVWEMGDFDAVTFNDEGEAVGLVEAMDHLAERYPYLVDDSKVEVEEPEVPPTSGSSTNRMRKPAARFSRKSLEAKYPELVRDGQSSPGWIPGG